MSKANTPAGNTHTENGKASSAPPFKNKVPTLRQASKSDPYGMNVKKSCATCRWFTTEPLAAPGGWCRKFPSQQVNCGVGDVCDCWEQKGKAGALLTEQEVLSRIIDGAAGYQVVLPRMQGKKVAIDTLNYKAQVSAVMSSLGCQDKEYIINALSDERVKAEIVKKVPPGELALKLIEEKPQE